MAWQSLGNPAYPFERGLHALGNGAYAWLQPDGGWGWSNAGLVVDGDQSLLVDTLFDVPLTQDMLDAMRAAEPKAAASIDTLVNTHANGDHCHGNELVEGAEIIASAAALQEMEELPPDRLALLMQGPGSADDLLGNFLRESFGTFQFEGIRQTLPTRSFTERLEIAVGDRPVRLLEVGPAHTNGDVLVHLPADRTIFTGDILFVEGTPLMWAGPVQNWIDACDTILSLDVETVVPGHGPVTDKRGAEAVRAYLVYIRDETRKCFDAGLSAEDAMLEIALGDFESWGDAERIAVNVETLYREFEGRTDRADTITLFTRMVTVAQARRQ